MCGDVRVLLPIAVAVVSVDVVRSEKTVNWLKNDSAVVVRDHIRVTILWFVVVQVRIFPRKLLTGINRLVLLRELEVVVSLEPLYVICQLGDPAVNQSISDTQLSTKLIVVCALLDA